MSENQPKADLSSLKLDFLGRKNNGQAIVLKVPMQHLAADSFDFHGFAKAIRTDKTLSREEKINYRASFTPSSKVQLDLNHPVSGLSAHVNSAMSSRWNPNQPDEPLAADHPLSKMWKEVWEQTTVHHAGEAALYQQRMAAKGLTFEDMNGYPAKTPPISLTHKIPGINAAAGPSGNGGVEAIVTQEFMDKIPPEQQRAVLLHEAQHAFEPVLRGQQPFTAFILNKAKSMVTANSSTREWERRADEHAAKLGAGNEIVDFFDNMGKFGTERIASQHRLLEHLVDHGFAFDPKKIATALNQANIELHDMGVADSDFGHLLPPLDKQINVAKLSERVDALNGSIVHAAKAGVQKEEKRPSFVDKIRHTIADKTADHPNHRERIAAVSKTEKCDGCDPQHPSKMHGDRVTEISKSGIQGWTR